MTSSNILTTLDNELYNKIKNFSYENIPYTIAHTINRKKGPPQNPYSLISNTNQTSDLSNKCFYDINGNYLCKSISQPIKSKDKTTDKKQVGLFSLDRLFS